MADSPGGNMNPITLTIDGRKITTTSDKTIFEAAKENGIDIPTLCHDEKLKPFTSCFICVVEVKGYLTPVPACSTRVFSDIEVTTNSENIIATRKMCLELLISDHCGDCFSPCSIECPANCDIQGYIKHIYHGEYKEAVKLIKDTIPLPTSIGRVCPALCENVCRRKRKDESLAICSLKRFAADKEGSDISMPYPGKPTNKKVAVVGGGPAGLSAAYQLIRFGHAVEVFEAQDKAGGMLRYGIPQYRLPKELLDKEISLIEKMGVKINYNKKLGKDIFFKDLRQNYDAVLLAIGAWSAAKMRVEGEEVPGVYKGIDFLFRVTNKEKIKLGDNVLVVGGGNTAMDCARTALRMGVKNVTIVYRRTKTEMPALPFEIVEAEHEGIRFNFLTAPLKIEKHSEKLKLHCIQMQLGEPDSSGRRKPVEVPNSEFALVADTIISAIGQKVEVSDIKDSSLALTKWETIQVNPDTCHTNLKNVFSAGDCVSGADLAVRAIGTGRCAAYSIDQYLNSVEITGAPKPYNISRGTLEEAPEEFYLRAKEIPKQIMPEIELNKRKTTFEEVVIGFSDNQAKTETERCLECGCDKTDDCKLRKLAEKYDIDPKKFAGQMHKNIIDASHPKIKIEYGKCILCGLCVRTCSEIKHIDALGFAFRGFATIVCPPFGKSLNHTKCDDCMECVKICPTGALSENGRPNTEDRSQKSENRRQKTGVR